MHWNQLYKLLILKYYRECCRITNTEVLKQTSSLLVIFDLCFIDELFFSDSVGFKKIYNRNYAVELLLLGTGNKSC